MTASKTQRGRPKGSGINDEQRLKEIACRLNADPSLKPTTAIKAIGVTDPSAIRRLRDKFHLVQSQQKSSPDSGSSMPSRPVASPQQCASPRLMETPAARTASLAPAPAMMTAPVEATVPDRNHAAAAALFGFGLTAASAMMEQQLIIAQSVFRLPAVRDFMRQQIELTEFMLAVASPSPGPRLTH